VRNLGDAPAGRLSTLLSLTTDDPEPLVELRGEPAG